MLERLVEYISPDQGADGGGAAVWVRACPWTASMHACIGAGAGERRRSAMHIAHLAWPAGCRRDGGRDSGVTWWSCEAGAKPVNGGRWDLRGDKLTSPYLNLIAARSPQPAARTHTMTGISRRSWRCPRALIGLSEPGRCPVPSPTDD